MFLDIVVILKNSSLEMLILKHMVKLIKIAEIID